MSCVAFAALLTIDCSDTTQLHTLLSHVLGAQFMPPPVLEQCLLTKWGYWSGADAICMHFVNIYVAAVRGASLRCVLSAAF